jgi:cation transport ATPase
MDTQIALGALSAYGYSIFQVSRGSLHLYFDTAAMLITIILLGGYVESLSRDKVTHGITELYQMARQKVRLLREGVERWAALDAVEAGEEFAVMQDERIPVDGRVVSGAARIDESFITGESRPIKRSAGEDVAAGGLLLEGDLVLRATSKGSESSLNQIVNLLQEALSRKNRVELIADRITRWLVPAVLTISAGTAAFLLLHRNYGFDEFHAQGCYGAGDYLPVCTWDRGAPCKGGLSGYGTVKGHSDTGSFRAGDNKGP